MSEKSRFDGSNEEISDGVLIDGSNGEPRPMGTEPNTQLVRALSASFLSGVGGPFHYSNSPLSSFGLACAVF